MGNFLAFGIGLSFPLFAFSLITANYSSKIISFLTRWKTLINRIAGVTILIISIYYLSCVFSVFGNGSIVGSICRPLDSIFGAYTGAF